MLQFVGGFGPRKAKKFISKIKASGNMLTLRSDVMKRDLTGNKVYL